MTKKIVWEDYNANFVDHDDESESNNAEDDIGFDDIDDEDEHDINASNIVNPGVGFFSFTKSFADLGSDVVQSPFGTFHKRNKWAPFNFYELKLIHLYGFSSQSDSAFGIKLDAVDGVAAWRCIDPYCFIIAKAKLYNWTEVKLNLEIAFGVRTMESEKIRQSIIEIKNKGEGYIGVIYPNGEYILNDYDNSNIDSLVDQYKLIIENLNGSKILIDGEIYFEN